MSDSLILFYITIPNEKTGQEIANNLLNKKLIACANIFPTHTSIYSWDGEIKNEKEQVMILKTLSEKALATEAEIKSLHPYECPCIVQIKAETANEDFLNWVSKQTP